MSLKSGFVPIVTSESAIFAGHLPGRGDNGLVTLGLPERPVERPVIGVQIAAQTHDRVGSAGGGAFGEGLHAGILRPEGAPANAACRRRTQDGHGAARLPGGSADVVASPTPVR